MTPVRQLYRADITYIDDRFPISNGGSVFLKGSSLEDVKKYASKLLTESFKEHQGTENINFVLHVQRSTELEMNTYISNLLSSFGV